MTCKHKQIRTWVFEDTEEPSGLWSCVDCGLKFEPLTNREWVGLTDEEISSVAYNTNPLDGIRAFSRAIEAKLKEKNT